MKQIKKILALLLVMGLTMIISQMVYGSYEKPTQPAELSTEITQKANDILDIIYEKRTNTTKYPTTTSYISYLSRVNYSLDNLKSSFNTSDLRYVLLTYLTTGVSNIKVSVQNDSSSLLDSIGDIINDDTTTSLINGKCGSSSGSLLISKPTTNLCLSGESSDVLGDGPWTWRCNGTNGGAYTRCKAYKNNVNTTNDTSSNSNYSTGNNTYLTICSRNSDCQSNKCSYGVCVESGTNDGGYGCNLGNVKKVGSEYKNSSSNASICYSGRNVGNVITNEDIGTITWTCSKGSSIGKCASTLAVSPTCGTVINSPIQGTFQGLDLANENRVGLCGKGTPLTRITTSMGQTVLDYNLENFNSSATNAIDKINSNTKYVYKCKGINTLETISCSTSIRIDGKCGSWNLLRSDSIFGTFDGANDSNNNQAICESGKFSRTDTKSSIDGRNYKYKCEGINGGSTVQCETSNSMACSATTINGFSIPIGPGSITATSTNFINISGGKILTHQVFKCNQPLSQNWYTIGEAFQTVICDTGYTLSGTACISNTTTGTTTGCQATTINGYSIPSGIVGSVKDVTGALAFISGGKIITYQTFKCDSPSQGWYARGSAGQTVVCNTGYSPSGSSCIVTPTSTNCTSGYTYSGTYNACIMPTPKMTLTQANCNSNGVVENWYKTYMGRCGEQTGIDYWYGDITAHGQSQANTAFINAVNEAIGTTNKQTYLNSLLCNAGDTYITNTIYCRK
ncbi:MAG: hypothetical protein PHN31_04695 [Candidatus Gracilibacteria bacterium]|nr:hypothetical protein [Candidatus Gracilibacteria bacterium]